jgi:hypothetical protein
MATSAPSTDVWTDFAATAATAQHIDPGTPWQDLPLPSDRQSFAFEVDRDLTKLVTISPFAGRMAIRVRYATDVVMEDHQHVLAVPGTARMSVDDLGVVISWRQRLIPGLAWPAIRRARRF